MTEYKRPVSVLVVIHTPDLQVLLIERADHPGYWQSITGVIDYGLATTTNTEFGMYKIHPLNVAGVTFEIGRASCRERV